MIKLDVFFRMTLKDFDLAMSEFQKYHDRRCVSRTIFCKTNSSTSIFLNHAQAIQFYIKQSPRVQSWNKLPEDLDTECGNLQEKFESPAHQWRGLNDQVYWSSIPSMMSHDYSISIFPLPSAVIASTQIQGIRNTHSGTRYKIVVNLWRVAVWVSWNCWGRAIFNINTVIQHLFHLFIKFRLYSTDCSELQCSYFDLSLHQLRTALLHLAKTVNLRCSTCVALNCGRKYW